MIVLTTTQDFVLAAAGSFQPFDSVVFILFFKKKKPELKFNHLMSLYTGKVSSFLQKLELFKGRRDKPGVKGQPPNPFKPFFAPYFSGKRIRFWKYKKTNKNKKKKRIISALSVILV